MEKEPLQACTAEQRELSVLQLVVLKVAGLQIAVWKLAVLEEWFLC